jgi:hypothetical protein
MQLVRELERLLEQEDSLFRAQLLREDLARLAKLRALAQGEADPAAFMKAGMHFGWTQGDARTGELREVLEPLLAAVYAFEKGKRDAEQEALIAESWRALARVRMERLVGCLSTPAPRPAD